MSASLEYVLFTGSYLGSPVWSRQVGDLFKHRFVRVNRVEKRSQPLKVLHLFDRSVFTGKMSFCALHKLIFLLSLQQGAWKTKGLFYVVSFIRGLCILCEVHHL